MKEEKELIEQISHPTSRRRQVQKKDGREVLDILLWDKLESTPHGRYGKMMEGATSNPQKAELYRSNVCMDHFKVKASPAKIKQQYFPGGKKVFPNKCPVSQF